MDHCNGLIHYQDICHYLGAHFDNIKKNAWRSVVPAPPSPHECYAGPMVITDPVSTTVTTNDTLTLNCTAVNNEGAPDPLMFRWVFDGNFLPNSLVVSTPPDENNAVTSTLTVPSVTRANAGMYQCLAFNRDVMDEDRSEVVTVTVNC